MKIAGFGDSFITDNALPYSYTNLIGKHFDTDFKHFGYQGSGAWDAFFQFKKSNVDADVVLFVWSNSARLYHNERRNICFSSTLDNKNSTDPIWKAALAYYSHLFSLEKTIHEHIAFYYWVDDWLKENYPNTKFIHMWGFPASRIDSKNIRDAWDDPENFSYYHTWKNGVDVKPALINLSYQDGWPGDLSRETRCHHMTPKMHQVLANYVIDAIENYEPGRQINMS